MAGVDIVIEEKKDDGVDRQRVGSTFLSFRKVLLNLVKF